MAIKAIWVNESAIGESWALAVDEVGRPVRQLWQRWSDTHARFGETTSARIVALAPKQGGAFLELEGGEAAFLAAKETGGIAEGARLNVTVLAEARRGKLARVVSGRAPGETSLLERWMASLPGGSGSPASNPPPDLWSGALALAAEPVVPLPGGGRLQVVPTPALVAVDVDTAGRVDEGRASARALAINLDAAHTLARVIAFRDLGGLVVLDCIGPLSREGGAKVRTAFLDTFRSLSVRRVQCLAPSPFGLMEISLAWQAAPLHERLVGADGRPVPESILLEGLRALAREAEACPADRLRLSLPEDALALVRASSGRYEKALAAKYGARLAIAPAPRGRLEVTRT